jgi:hypothetical protein
MKKRLNCDNCRQMFYKSGEKMYVVDIKEVKFYDEGEYICETSKTVQLCEKCFNENDLNNILKKQNRLFE